MSAVIDTKPYVEHDPVVGYRYVAGTRRTLPRPGGGEYEIVINADGIRSDREFSAEVPKGRFRILVFGDSYAAGQFVSNQNRFTELLERRNPAWEVINFALEGTGTDQQLLLYEQVADRFEHQLVILFPFLQNIRRNLVEARAAFDPETGLKVLRPKPRFELIDGELHLRNSPVPAEAPPAEGAAVGPADPGFTSDERQGVLHQMKASLSRSSLGRSLKSWVYAVKPWEPFPEYRDPQSAGWTLMEAILGRFGERVSPRPFVIVPLFYDSYVRYRMARNYWKRFAKLEQENVHVLDLLPHFRQLGSGAVKCYQVPHDCHFSNFGHLVVAEALERELKIRGLAG